MTFFTFTIFAEMDGPEMNRIISARCGREEDYFSDLNACHRMETALPVRLRKVYVSRLAQIVPHPLHWDFNLTHASPAHRCEAFLDTIRKYENSDLRV